jgi:hypothetical protein
MAARKKSSGRKYGKAAGKSVKSAMKRRKKGTLHSGSERGPKVKSREQAIAIGLSEARAKGAKVPRKKTAKKSSAKKGGARKKSTSKRSTAKKGGARKKSASKRSSAKKTRAKKSSR